ncbi:MAG: ATP-binding protein [Bradymonadaceae bacterium]
MPERDRHKSEERYRTLFESIDEGVCFLEMIFDADEKPVDYRFLEVNATFEAQTGLVNPVGKTARELVPELDAFWFETYGKVALTGESIRFKQDAPAMDRSFEVFAVRVGRAEDRQVALWFKDITEHVHNEERFRTIADTAPAILWMTNEHNECIFLSEGWHEFTGQTDAEGLGMGWLDAVHPADREGAGDEFLGGSQRLEPFSLDIRICSRDGLYRWTIDSGRPRYDSDGKWLGYIGSVIDVHDRKLAEERLREADRRKDHFMAVLSHELRNPLAPIKHSLYVLDNTEPGTELAVEARAIIGRQVNQLTRLVDDLLDLTRVARDKVSLQRRRIELNELVRHTVEDHRALFEENEIDLTFRESQEPVYVDGDWNRLAQCVGNLLQNAAKFTPPGESTSVFVERAGTNHRAHIRITDTGVGMTEETMDGIFEPFMQADSSLAHSTGGLGLGLPLVQGLTELHGGGIRATSKGLDQGSEFIIWLPLDISARPEPEARATPLLKGARKVLIIEDTVDVAQSLGTVLELKGHEVDIAYNGPEGIERARVFRPAIVLCDIGLPGMDGYQVARTFRADPELSSIQLVALSGYAMPTDIQRSMDAGFSHHIAKPPEFIELQALIANAPES